MHEDVKQHQFKAGTPTMGNRFSRCCDSCQLVVCNGLSTVDGGVLAILFILALYGVVGFWMTFKNFP